MPAYCTKHDALDWLGGGNVRTEARLLASVDIATGTLVLDGHALKTGRQCRFSVKANGSMPAPLLAAEPYYVIELTDSTFQVSETAGGPPVILTSAGSNVAVIRLVPWEEYIEDASAEIDELLIGNAPVANGKVPRIVQHYASALVIERALIFSGAGVDEALDKRLRRVHESFERHLKGKPIRAAEAPPATNTAVRTPRASGSAADFSGFSRGVIP